MTKFFFTAIAASLLSGCALVDPFFGTSEGTVVSVDRERGCSVTFQLKGKTQMYFSEAETLYGKDKCRRLQPGMTVPVVVNPIYGDYPYVLFEETGR